LLFRAPFEEIFLFSNNHLVIFSHARTLGMEVQAEILQTRVKKIIFFAKSKKIVTALLEAEALKDLTWIVVTEGEMNWIDAKQS
jgi:hypothetical protein